MSGQHLVHDDTKGEEIRAMVGLETACLLGCHVRDGSHHHACGCVDSSHRRQGLCALCELGEPKVQQLDATVVRHEDVLRLQVTMDDVGAMRRGQTTRNLHGVVERLP